MATTKITSLSIADIEKQIVKIGAEIEKARAQELKTAEKTLATAKKSAATAKAHLAKLKSKDATTAAEKARIAAAKKTDADHDKALSIAKQTVDALTVRNRAAEKLAKTVSKTLASANKGKKAKKPVTQKPIKETTSETKKERTKEPKKLEQPQEVAKKIVHPKKTAAVDAEQTTDTAKTNTDVPDVSAPMTAKPKDSIEETKAVPHERIDAPENSDTLDTESDGEVLSTNIEQPSNNATI
ncbi:MAG: hypothetical protein V4732_18290 [Pseudomonadota bacterium]